MRRILDATLKKQLIDNRIPDELALNHLKNLARRDLRDRRLDETTAGRLKLIGQRTVDAQVFSELRFQTEDEAEEFLRAMWKAGILGRETAGKRERYSLKGFAKLCLDWELLPTNAQSIV
jgi:hypothetical protein